MYLIFKCECRCIELLCKSSTYWRSIPDVKDNFSAVTGEATSELSKSCALLRSFGEVDTILLLQLWLYFYFHFEFKWWLFLLVSCFFHIFHNSVYALSFITFPSFLSFSHLISRFYTPLYHQPIFILSLPLIVGWSDGNCESLCHRCSKFQMWCVYSYAEYSLKCFSWHNVLVFFNWISYICRASILFSWENLLMSLSKS
jgi:hypothetical protein